MLMKRQVKMVVFIVLGIILAVGIGVGVTLFASSYLSLQNTDCRVKGTEHTVVIKNGEVTPSHTEGHACDTLTITNTDDVSRLMAFGRHDKHVAYDGVSQRYLSKDQSIQVTMVSLGEYLFHDHEDDDVFGTFTVTAN
jgi:hypothetical protein